MRTKTIVLALGALLLTDAAASAGGRARTQTVAPAARRLPERSPGDADWTRIDRYQGTTTVITRKMMDDYNATTLCDALRLVPGVGC